MSYQKLTIIGNGVTISLNINLHPGQNFYTVTNVKEMLSSLDPIQQSLEEEKQTRAEIMDLIGQERIRMNSLKEESKQAE